MVALITGASRGIGEAIARGFAREGYDVIITCKSSVDKLMSVKADIEATGRRCLARQTDCGSYEDTRALFDDIASFTSQLDVVVNNAAISYVGLLTDMTKDAWDTMLHTNLSSLFHTCKFAVPIMVQSKSGVIINVSSMWGEHGASCEVAYSASKGGVNSFTKALAKELAPSGIRVNAIACGVIDTAMNQWLDDEEQQDLINTIGLSRLGQPSEIADAATFLASNKANYITGQIITIDGGYDY